MGNGPVIFVETIMDLVIGKIPFFFFIQPFEVEKGQGVKSTVVLLIVKEVLTEKQSRLH